MTTIQIRRRTTNAVIYSGEHDSLYAAMVAAVAARANLARANLADADLAGANLADADLADADLAGANLARANLADADLARANLADANLAGANLADANLADADLAGANLARANLADANLAGANLADANLVDANLRGANLADANLVDANLRGANLSPIRDDVRLILAAAPNEVPALLSALRDGIVDGSLYEGECACLLGTIANARHCHYESIPGLAPDSDRPAERFALAVRRGDTPATNQVSALLVQWCEEWQRGRWPTDRMGPRVGWTS